MARRTPEQVAAEIEVIRDADRRRRSLTRTNWRELFAAGLISDAQAEYQALSELHSVDIFANRAAS